MKSSELVFIGIRGAVVALNRNSGVRAWVARLKGSEFVNVVLEGNYIFAATYGEIFCLDPVTGQRIWHNPLKGYGTGLATIATSFGSSAPFLAETERRQRQSAAAAAVTAAS
jgi:outer membrane protein assembly factor BamB